MTKMKRSIASLFVLSFALFATATFAQTRSSQTEKPAIVAEPFADNNSIAGSWYVMATPDGAPPFRGMITFTGDGSVIASAQGDILLDLGSLATAGHGAWRRVGNREFVFTFRQILYTPNNSYDGEARIRHNAVMDKSCTSWTGQLVVEIFNANDEVVFVGTGSGTATRIVAEGPQE